MAAHWLRPSKRAKPSRWDLLTRASSWSTLRRSPPLSPTCTTSPVRQPRSRASPHPIVSDVRSPAARPSTVLHRDLKAANVFLTSRNLVKVGDFGIAKVLEASGPDGSGALARTAVGTPYYLAPELVSGEPYAFKADMWAVGVLLYELIALRRPFEAKTLPHLAMKIVNCEYPPPPSGYSSELVALVSSLLSRDPAMRPTSQQVCEAPLVRRHHARLLAQLRSLALLNFPHVANAEPADGAAYAAAADTAAEADVESAPPPPPPATVTNSTAHEEPEHGIGGQGARAEACALRVQSMLGAEPVAAVTPPVASAGEGAPQNAATGATPTEVAANMRFSLNLHALELNLANIEQTEQLPERTPRRVGGTPTPFTSPLSACSALTSPSAVLTSPPPLGISNTLPAAAAGGQKLMKSPSGWVETRRKRSMAVTVSSVAPSMPMAPSERRCE